MVIKSQYATLKDSAKSLMEAERRYYLVNDIYTLKLSDLDIEVGTPRSVSTTDLPNGGDCFIQSQGLINISMVARCSKVIFGTRIEYQSYVSGLIRCVAFTANTSDIHNQVCQQETGRTTPTEVSRARTCNVYPYNYVK